MHIKEICRLKNRQGSPVCVGPPRPPGALLRTRSSSHPGVPGYHRSVRSSSTDPERLAVGERRDELVLIAT